MTYLEQHSQQNRYTYEVIIVDDGSRDNTWRKALEWTAKFGVDKVRLLKLVNNQGKGGAVQQGMLHARGRTMLMVDADGATDIRDFEPVLKSLHQLLKTASSQLQSCAISNWMEPALVCGSRAHLDDAEKAKRTPLRKFISWVFHFGVALISGIHSVRDTQCGFKLFTRGAVRTLFATQHLRRWCFDVELLYVAQSLKYKISEQPVRWHEVPGSKLNVLQASIQMARDLVLIRLCYMLSVWRVTNLTKHP